MNDPLGPQDDAGTPLTEEEREGLIPSYITLRNELNEAEQANILEARAWAFRRGRDVLDERFLNRLHERIYGNVWRWAGEYRTSGKNIGVVAYRIPTELRQLLDDCPSMGHTTPMKSQRAFITGSCRSIPIPTATAVTRASRPTCC